MVPFSVNEAKPAAVADPKSSILVRRGETGKTKIRPERLFRVERRLSAWNGS